jgi:hypothetical protein
MFEQKKNTPGYLERLKREICSRGQGTLNQLALVEIAREKHILHDGTVFTLKQATLGEIAHGEPMTISSFISNVLDRCVYRLLSLTGAMVYFLNHHQAGHEVWIPVKYHTNGVTTEQMLIIVNITKDNHFDVYEFRTDKPLPQDLELTLAEFVRPTYEDQEILAKWGDHNKAQK